MRRFAFLSYFIALATVFAASFSAADSAPYEMLSTTPNSVCANLILGAKYGKPLNSHALDFFESLIGLRYDVETKGLEPILARGDEGILFLPNHTAYIDPLVMFAAIGRDTNVRPVVTEELTRGAGGGAMKHLIGLANAFIIPNRKTRGELAAPATQAILSEIDNATRHGDNVLLYPSGRVQNSSQESIGNRTGLEQLMHLNPNRRVVLVRERGLWGSSWSRGAEGLDLSQQVSTGNAILRGLTTGAATLLGNLIFWAPKRHVTLEFFEPMDFPRRGTRDEMNAYIEKFYNSPENAEQRTFVRRFFWQFWKTPIRVEESEQDHTTSRLMSPVGRSEVVDIEMPR